jgi:hypothetical protein
LIKGMLHQEEITIVNIYAPNISALNFIPKNIGTKSTDRFQHNNNG